MPIFRIDQRRLSQVQIQAFQNEREMQSITESNLEEVFGLKFIFSEFSIGNFRLDTIGFDPEINSFVIIEYKKNQNFSIIDQGYAYLSLMLNHKADFVLVYNENTGINSAKRDFDWSQSRVIFVSPRFTPYQMQAINFRDLPIELWEVHLYSNETIRYNKIRPYQIGASIGSVSKAAKDIEKVSSEVKVFSEESILKKVNEEIREAYLRIKDIVYQINADVEEKVKKSMICFYTGGKGLVWVKPTKKRITMWLRKGQYKNRNGELIQEGWGNYPEINIPVEEIDLTFVSKLIKQANDL